ncbi:hypothetical protein ER70_07505 (plasmid) [Borreliella bissettiae]|uniref:Uncharacterized protein n=1 Tax=Borrelia bissettiae TaxID=64897 RepID=A0A1L8ZA85_BORBI|nr:hypothetical protein ER70_07505 [Borreliella bissettiae]
MRLDFSFLSSFYLKSKLYGGNFFKILSRKYFTTNFGFSKKLQKYLVFNKKVIYFTKSNTAKALLDNLDSIV